MTVCLLIHDANTIVGVKTCLLAAIKAASCLYAESLAHCDVVHSGLGGALSLSYFVYRLATPSSLQFITPVATSALAYDRCRMFPYISYLV